MNNHPFRILFLSLVLSGITVLRAVPAGMARTGGVSHHSAQDATAQQTAEAPKTASNAVTKGRPDDIKSEIVEHLKAGMILDYATFLVAVVTIIFAIFLGVIGALEWLKFRNLRNELSAQREDQEEQRKELATERRSLGIRIETFKSELEGQEQRLTASQRFLEAVLSHHSALLVGIVEAFGASLKPEEARKLKSRIFEAEAALDLFHPDDSEVHKALRRLEEIGSDGAVSSLAQLRDDKTTDPEIRLRAQRVLTKVKERLKNAGQPA
jgi:hypothetical protein